MQMKISKIISKRLLFLSVKGYTPKVFFGLVWITPMFKYRPTSMRKSILLVPELILFHVVIQLKFNEINFSSVFTGSIKTYFLT